MDAYLVALRQEIQRCAPSAEGRVVQTVYFGGGTPTLYPSEALAGILDLLSSLFRFPLSCQKRGLGGEASPAPEVTCEANPGTVDEASLTTLRAAGFNRLSLGVQSFRAEELRLLGRIHSGDEARAAVAAARAAGFANLSLDLIAGLPGQTPAAWAENLHAALALRPEHLSCYGLSIPSGTALAQEVDCGRLTPLDDSVAAALWELTDAALTAAGYEHYEISNFAKPGYESRHNLTYWRNGEYLGLGVSAASYLQGRRWTNLAGVAEYAERLAHGQSVEADSETLGPRERLGETIMLGLRLAAGVEVAALRAEFGAAAVAALEPVAERQRELGLLEPGAERWRPTRRGMQLNNQLAAAFLAD
jgi:oxygen-independent coproporphyrinogen-3 oxidase